VKNSGLNKGNISCITYLELLVLLSEYLFIMWYPFINVFFMYAFCVVIVYFMCSVCFLFNVLLVYCLLFVYLVVYVTNIVLTLPPGGQPICSSVIINKQTPWPLVRERTISTERPPLVDEI
jgi:hypothetical protein